jgi:Tol biopolymer transport system component
MSETTGGHLRRNVLGLVAIVFALSGVLYAAGLAPNVAGSAPIADGRARTPGRTDAGIVGPKAGQGKRAVGAGGRATWIAFNRFDPDLGKVRIYAVRRDGTGLHAISRPPAGADLDQLPDISPDGSKVVFSRIYNNGRPDALIVVNANGRHPRNISDATCTGECLGSAEPAWSPDGSQIAFQYAIGPIPPDGPPPVIGISVSNADGSDVLPLTQFAPGSGTEDHNPTWSPNGHRIAFMRSNNTKEPENASSIFVMDADGGDLHRIRRMPSKWPGSGIPKWAPSGRRILFSTYCAFGDCGQPLRGAQLFTIRPNGEDVRRLTSLPGNSYKGNWSPSGRRIVFARNSKVCCPPSGDLYVMRRDGSHLRRLTNAPRLDSHNADWGRRR